MTDAIAIAQLLAEDAGENYVTDGETFVTISQPGDREQTFQVTVCEPDSDLVRVFVSVEIAPFPEREAVFYKLVNELNRRVYGGAFTFAPGTQPGVRDALTYRRDLIVDEHESIDSYLLGTAIEHVADTINDLYFIFQIAAWSDETVEQCLEYIEGRGCGHA